MDRWKQSLDRYLTTPPDDNWEGFYEDVADSYTEEQYKYLEDNKLFDSYQEQDWIDELIARDYTDTKQVATIVYRAFKLYKLKGFIFDIMNTKKLIVSHDLQSAVKKAKNKYPLYII